MEFISRIFIDASIATCASKRCGIICGNALGFFYRLLEFGVVSVLPPIILIETTTKYKCLSWSSILRYEVLFKVGRSLV